MQVFSVEDFFIRFEASLSLIKKELLQKVVDASCFLGVERRGGLTVIMFTTMIITGDHLGRHERAASAIINWLEQRTAVVLLFFTRSTYDVCC